MPLLWQGQAHELGRHCCGTSARALRSLGSRSSPPYAKGPAFPGARLYLKRRKAPDRRPAVTRSARCEPATRRHCCGTRSCRPLVAPLLWSCPRGVARCSQILPQYAVAPAEWIGAATTTPMRHCCGAGRDAARREGSHGVHRYSDLAALLGAETAGATVVAPARARHCCGAVSCADARMLIPQRH